MERALRAARADRRRDARAAPIDRPAIPFGVEPATLRLRRAKIARPARRRRFPTPTSQRILGSLGLRRSLRRRRTAGTSPCRRGAWTSQREVDLIEEIARHYGFDRLPVTFPALTLPRRRHRIRASQRARQLRARADRRRLLRGRDVRLHRPRPRRRRSPPRATSCRSPTRCPRTSPCCGRRCCPGSSTPSPTTAGASSATCGCSRSATASRAAAASGARSRAPGPGSGGTEHWSGGTREVDFFDMKGVVERLCEALRVETRTEPHREAWLAPGRAAAVMTNGTRIGVLGQLAPAVAERARAAAVRRGLRRRDRSRRRRTRAPRRRARHRAAARAIPP